MSDLHVITAAHCVPELKPDGLVVAIGYTKIDRDGDGVLDPSNKHKFIMEVAKIVSHPGYK